MTNTSLYFDNAVKVLCLFGIALITYLLYSKGLTGPLMFDDALVIPSTQLEVLSYDTIAQALTNHNSGIFGRPIPLLSFIFNYHFFGDQLVAYKSVNLLIHGFNSLLIFFFSIKLFGVLNNVSDPLKNSPSAFYMALVVTVLWTIHPLQISTVLYIFQRMTLLSSFFTLIALNAYIYGRQTRSPKTRNTILLFGVLPISIVLSLLSKENGALIIPYIMLLEFVLFQRDSCKPTYFRTTQVIYGAVFAVPIGLALAYFFTHSSQIMEGYISRDFTLVDRLRTESVAILYYIKLILIPNISEMSLYHDGFPRFRTFTFTVILSLFSIGLLLVSVFILKKRAPAFSVGIGFFFVAHSLESTFLPLELVFEHRNYLALFGVCVPLVFYISRIICQQKKPFLYVLPMIPIFLFVSGLTYSRSIEWSDEVLMHTLAVENKPESIRARKILVSTLSNNQWHQKAFDSLAESIQLYPDNVSFRLISVAMECRYRLSIEKSMSEAKSHLTSKMFSQDVPNILYALYEMAESNTCDGLTLTTFAELSKAAIDSEHVFMPRRFKRNLFALDANLNIELGNHEQAIKSLNFALINAPNDPWLVISLVKELIITKEFDDAASQLNLLDDINRKRLFAFTERIDSLRDSLRKNTKTNFTENF